MRGTAIQEKGVNLPVAAKNPFPQHHQSATRKIPPAKHLEKYTQRARDMPIKAEEVATRLACKPNQPLRREKYFIPKRTPISPPYPAYPRLNVSNLLGIATTNPTRLFASRIPSITMSLLVQQLHDASDPLHTPITREALPSMRFLPPGESPAGIGLHTGHHSPENLNCARYPKPVCMSNSSDWPATANRMSSIALIFQETEAR